MGLVSARGCGFGRQRFQPKVLASEIENTLSVFDAELHARFTARSNKIIADGLSLRLDGAPSRPHLHCKTLYFENSVNLYTCFQEFLFSIGEIKHKIVEGLVSIG